MMKGKIINFLYKFYLNYFLVELKEDNYVLIQMILGGDILLLDVFYVVILIGVCLDLLFFLYDGKNFGVILCFFIDSKYNFIYVDLYFYQCVVEIGLFLMGLLVGDNFVRFGLGGSLGITNYLLFIKNK